MPLGHENNVMGSVVDHPEVKDAVMKVLVSPEEGWEDNVLRVFELEPGGYTPKHSHDWPHINYVIEGEGALFLNGKENPIKAVHMLMYQITNDTSSKCRRYKAAFYLYCTFGGT